MPRYLINNTREREAAIQRRLLAVLERRFRRLVAAEVAREMRRLVDGYSLLGAVPLEDITHNRRMTAIYSEMSAVAVRTFGNRIVNQGKSLGEIETKGFAEFFARLAEQWVTLEAIRQRIASVTNTTRERIIAEVVKGQREGLGVAEIAKLISDTIPSISRLRGSLIARTETHGAANYGAHETAKSTGLDLRKEWISVEDHRTRDFGQGDGKVDEFDHRSMDGQTVGMDDPFLMPWLKGEPFQCQFPGDTSLPPGGSINCRCSVAHVVFGLDD